jgi:hypothetical protein
MPERSWSWALASPGTRNWCTWCGADLRGKRCVLWWPLGKGRAFLGCWRCTFLRAAHSIMGPDGLLPNPVHRHCTRPAA